MSTPTPSFVQLAGIVEQSTPASGFNVPVSGVTSGNTLVVVVANQAGAGIVITGVTDANGNSYSACAGASVNAAPGGTQTQMAMFFAKGVKGGAFNVNPTWTGTASSVAVYVFELLNANSYDNGSGGSGTTATADSGAFTTQNQAIVLGATINTLTGLSAGTGYTLIQITPTFEDVLEYKIAAAGSQDAQANLNGAQNWGMVAGAFFFAPPSDADFQDYVRMSQDTLYHTGAMFQLGGSTATWLTFGMSNSAGLAALAANPTTSQTFWLPQSVTQDTVAVLGNLTTTPAAISAGTQIATSGTVVFSNSNNVSFGMSGSSRITASARVNVSAGTTSNNLSAVTFSNSNGISFGLNGSVITGSIATSLSVVNFSAGTTSGNLGSVVLSNSNNVSFGLNGSTVTASANLTGDWYDNVVMAQPDGVASGAMGSVSNFTASASSLFVAPLHGYGQMFPFDLSASTFFFPDLSVSGSTATMSVAFTSVWRLGLYTLNGSTLSLLNSASCSFGFGAAATNNSTGFAGGFRYVTFGSANWSSNPVFRYGSRYWLAWFWSSAGALNQTGSMGGAFMFSSGQRSGFMGQSSLTATSNGPAPFLGIYTAQTAAMPNSIGSNQLQKTGSMAGFVPHFMMAANASLTIF